MGLALTCPIPNSKFQEGNITVDRCTNDLSSLGNFSSQPDLPRALELDTNESERADPAQPSPQHVLILSLAEPGENSPKKWATSATARPPGVKFVPRNNLRVKKKVMELGKKRVPQAPGEPRAVEDTTCSKSAGRLQKGCNAEGGCCEDKEKGEEGCKSKQEHTNSYKEGCCCSKQDRLKECQEDCQNCEAPTDNCQAACCALAKDEAKGKESCKDGCCDLPKDKFIERCCELPKDKDCNDGCCKAEKDCCAPKDEDKGSNDDAPKEKGCCEAPQDEARESSKDGCCDDCVEVDSSESGGCKRKECLGGCCEEPKSKRRKTECMDGCCEEPKSDPRKTECMGVEAAKSKKECRDGCCDDGDDSEVEASEASAGCKDGCCNNLPSAPRSAPGTLATEGLAANSHIMVTIQGMDCASCGLELEAHGRKLEGVASISVSTVSNCAQLSFDSRTVSEARVLAHLNTLKFTVSLKPVGVHVALAFDPSLEPGSCRSWLESQLGVLTATPVEDRHSHLTKLQLCYDPTMIGSRTLLKRFDEQFPSTQPAALSEVTPSNDGSAQVRDLGLHFWVSLALAVPLLFSAFISPHIEEVNTALMMDMGRGLPLKYFLELLLATPVQTWVAWPIYRSAWEVVTKVHRTNMDFLVALSTSISYLLSVGIVLGVLSTGSLTSDAIFAEVYFSASALVLCLVLFGRFLEVFVKRRASRVLTSLRKLQAGTATLITPDNPEGPTPPTQLLHLSSPSGLLLDRVLLQYGDQLRVLPGERIPTDGQVLRGTSHVNESMLSGESVPVAKQAASPVFAGTTNVDGMLVMQVTRVLGENQIDQIALELERTQLSKAKLEGVVDRISNIFVIAVVSLALAIVLLWLALTYTGTVTLPVNAAPFSFSLKFGLTLLIVACPCALGLAAPTAILVGTGVAARHSLLLKGGDVVERMPHITTVCFDKTGTLTAGKLQVVEAHFYSSQAVKSVRDMLHYASSAELGSEHPIAAAVVAYASAQPGAKSPTEPRAHKVLPGLGISCQVRKKRVLVGNAALLKKKQVKLPSKARKAAEEHQSKGRTLVLVAVDGICVGALAIADEPKLHAASVVAWLKRRGLEVYMVSGDHKQTCAFVAGQVGIEPERVVAEVQPLKKAALVRELQEQGKRVLMVGDGINDAVALAQADVGVAIGTGAQISADVADLVLLVDDLRILPTAIDLCRTIYRRIKINLGWAFLYNSLMIPIAAGVLYYPANIVIPPAFAGLSELLSTFPIFFISLALRHYRAPTIHEDA